MRSRPSSTATLLVLIAACACGGGSESAHDDALDTVLAGIQPSAIQAHVEFLAHDRLAGRRTGTLGYQAAAEHVADQFAEMGLLPMGDEGSYLARVPLRRASVVAGTSSMSLIVEGREEALVSGVDYVPGARMDDDDGTIDAAAVFVGFGVSAPRLGYDDYEGIDVRDRVVVVLRGSPASLERDAAAHYSSARVKNETAAAKGAVAVITILPPTSERRGSWESAVASAERGRTQWLQADGMPPDGASLATASVSGSGAEKLFSAVSGTFTDVLRAAESNRPGSFDLGVSVRLTTHTEHSDLDGFNVMGLLPGSDPALAEEYLLVTAHLDHVGIGRPLDGDSIYNGAADNAAGVASLIEVARALANLPVAPRKAVLFVATTAEEEGLLGARYLAANPVSSPGTLIANLNMDGNLMLYPMADIIAVGGEHTTLGSVVERAAVRVGLTRQPDPMPEQNLFIRSDHYAFVLKGIPSVALMIGTTSADASIDGTAVLNEWIATRLHKPGDDAAQAFDYESGADYVRIAFLVAEEVANANARPRWLQGDFFGETLGADR